jgi:hypothetical protein
MDVNVRTQLDHFPHQLTWIASVATALLCAVVTAAFMAWMPTAIGNPEDHATPAGVASDAPTRTTCAECGVIESVREIDTRGDHGAESTRSYEFIIRFPDGSRRVFNEATPRTWRSGTRVRVI